MCVSLYFLHGLTHLPGPPTFQYAVLKAGNSPEDEAKKLHSSKHSINTCIRLSPDYGILYSLVPRYPRGGGTSAWYTLFLVSQHNISQFLSTLAISQHQWASRIEIILLFWFITVIGSLGVSFKSAKC